MGLFMNSIESGILAASYLVGQKLNDQFDRFLRRMPLRDIKDCHYKRIGEFDLCNLQALEAILSSNSSIATSKWICSSEASSP